MTLLSAHPGSPFPPLAAMILFPALAGGMGWGFFVAYAVALTALALKSPTSGPSGDAGDMTRGLHEESSA